MPDEPRYAPLEYPEEIRNAPAGDIFDFFPESWRKMDLSGVWKLKRYSRDEGAALDRDPGLEGGYQKVEIHDNDWEDIGVPWSLSYTYPEGGREYFQGVGWYRRHFEIPNDWEKLLEEKWRVLLRFEGADQIADAWLNGASVGMRMTGYHAMSYDITDEVLSSGRNVLAVRVYASRSGYRQRARDGIWRPVRLICVPPVYARRILVAPNISTASLDFRIQMVNHLESLKVNLSAMLTPFNSRDTKNQIFSLGSVEIEPGESELSFRIDTPGIKLWWPDSPNLYFLSLSDGALDLGRVRFGYRTFEAKDGTFFLNGREIKLMGYAFSHNSFLSASRRWQVNGENWSRRLLYGLRQANVDFIRNHSGGCGPLPKTLFYLCDELGMLVYDEPHYIGKSDLDEERFSRRKEDYRQWVLQNHNHPSLVMWDYGGNERYTRDLEYIPVFNELYDLLTEVDMQKRPRTSSSGRHFVWLMNQMPVMEKVDFADAHGYQGYYYGSPEAFTRLFPDLRKVVQEKFGDVPVLDCEYAFPSDIARYRAVTRDIRDLYERSPWSKADKREYIEFITSETPETGGYLRSMGNWSSGRTYTLDPMKVFENGAQFIQRYLEIFRRTGDVINGGHTNNPWYVALATPGGGGESQAARHMGVPNPIAESGNGFFKTPAFYAYRRTYSDIFICLDAYDKNVFAGRKWSGLVHVMNDWDSTKHRARAMFQLRDPDGRMIHQQQVWTGDIVPQTHEKIPFQFNLPSELESGVYHLELFLMGDNGQRLSDTRYPLRVVNDKDFTDALNTSRRVLIYESAAGRSGETPSIGSILKELNVRYTLAGNLDELDEHHVLIIGKDALDDVIQANGIRIYRWTEAGGRLLCLEQTRAGALPFLPEISIAAERGEHKDIVPGARFTEILVREHPIFRGLSQEDFMDWNGGGGLLFNWGLYPLNEGLLSVGPTIRGLGGRTDSFKMVSTAYSVGAGEMVLSQYNAVERYGQDPIATRFMQNLIEYILTEPRSNLSLPFASVKMRED